MDEVFRDRVRERDLDNFLVEELHASSDFLDWVLDRVRHAIDRPPGAVSMQKSPPRERDRRQTDVRIGWLDGSGDVHACVLIESKVTADFQHGQAEAYSEELSALRARLGPRCAAALLVAPRARLSSLGHGGAFDAELAVEEIVEFLQARRAAGVVAEVDRRLEARAQLLEALCGKRPGSGWIGSTVREKRDFAQAYADLVAEMLPDLRVRPSTDGPKAITRIFEGLELPGLPKATLRHEFGPGTTWKYANAQFAGAGAYVGTLRRSQLLDQTGFTVEEAGKSLAVRVRTPAIDPMRPFDEERPAVVEGLTAIRGLVDWLMANRAGVAGVLGAPTSANAPARDGDRDREFGEALRSTYDECDRLGYRPTGMLRMLAEHGGIETARRLLANDASEGLAKLTMLGRLDLSIESIVLQDRWDGLFSDAERRIARRRLR